MIDLSIDGVSAASTRIFTAAGVPRDMAEQITTWLVNSNLSGHPSHGLQRVTEYVRQIQEGHMDPAARPRVHVETDTTVVLDGQAGLGHFAADRLTRELAGKCRESQIAMGGIINGRHIGRLGEWGELAADLGVVLYISLGSASGWMTSTFGAAEGRLGTNPIAFGAPGLEGDSFVMDFATSAAAEGKVRVARDSGKSVPEGMDPGLGRATHHRSQRLLRRGHDADVRGAQGVGDRDHDDAAVGGDGERGGGPWRRGVGVCVCD